MDQTRLVHYHFVKYIITEVTCIVSGREGSDRSAWSSLIVASFRWFLSEVSETNEGAQHSGGFEYFLRSGPQDRQNVVFTRKTQGSALEIIQQCAAPDVNSVALLPSVSVNVGWLIRT